MPETLTFKPPPETRNPGIFAPGQPLGEKDDPKILFGLKTIGIQKGTKKK
tara:strand:+ start:174 stop:323 length:150 start_codon:yes stop_codon:yes gene_type:complete